MPGLAGVGVGMEFGEVMRMRMEMEIVNLLVGVGLVRGGRVVLVGEIDERALWNLDFWIEFGWNNFDFDVRRVILLDWNLFR